VCAVKTQGSVHLDFMTLILACLTALGGIVSFGLGLFETKDQARERADLVEKRLERIENKIDSIIQRTH
jgi:hypothetical protein